MYVGVGCKLKQNANEGCNSCASLVGLVSFIACFVLLVIAPSVLQPPQSGTHSHLAFVTLSLPILSVAFLKLLLPPGLRLHLAAHPSASDSTTVRKCKHAFGLTVDILSML